MHRRERSQVRRFRLRSAPSGSPEDDPRTKAFPLIKRTTLRTRSSRYRHSTLLRGRRCPFISVTSSVSRGPRVLHYSQRPSGVPWSPIPRRTGQFRSSWNRFFGKPATSTCSRSVMTFGIGKLEGGVQENGLDVEMMLSVWTLKMVPWFLMRHLGFGIDSVQQCYFSAEFIQYSMFTPWLFISRIYYL